MKLQTQIPLQPEQHQIDYHSKVLLMGSCFVENIGSRLQFFQFQAKVNPFGVIFHPKAIENLVERITAQRVFTESDIFYTRERWQSFEVHSQLADASKTVFLGRLNTVLNDAFTFLQSASHVVITLGTAWGYRHLETDRLVANCHKVPQKHFQKELFPVEAVADSLKKTVTLIQMLNPSAKIIFTVSPVRHLKDGFVENQRSKAHLIAAVHQALTGAKGGLREAYFPAYEVMMDELRDYRFYAEDMLHPNKLAVQYIWERFQRVWIDPSTTETMQEVEKVRNGLLHRPFNEQSEEFKNFRQKLQQKIAYLSATYPHMQF